MSATWAGHTNRIWQVYRYKYIYHCCTCAAVSLRVRSPPVAAALSDNTTVARSFVVLFLFLSLTAWKAANGFGGRLHRRWRGYWHGAHAQATGFRARLPFRSLFPLRPNLLHSISKFIPNLSVANHLNSQPVPRWFYRPPRSERCRSNTSRHCRADFARARSRRRRGRLPSRLAVQQIGRGVDGPERRGMQMTAASSVMMTDGRIYAPHQNAEHKKCDHGWHLACRASLCARAHSGSDSAASAYYNTVRAAIIPAAPAVTIQRMAGGEEFRNKNGAERGKTALHLLIRKRNSV